MREKWSKMMSKLPYILETWRAEAIVDVDGIAGQPEDVARERGRQCQCAVQQEVRQRTRNTPRKRVLDKAKGVAGLKPQIGHNIGLNIGLQAPNQHLVAWALS